MTGRVNHVKCVRFPIHLPRHAHGLRLDSDAAFALNVHAIQVLITHDTLFHDAGQLEHAVSQR